MSFGERLSTRLFAAHLRACGVPARQHDTFAPAFNLATSDDFGAADVAYDAALPAVRAALARPPGQPCAIPVVTGFLGRGLVTGVAPTCACLLLKYLMPERSVNVSLMVNGFGWAQAGGRACLHMQLACNRVCTCGFPRVCTCGFSEHPLAPLCTEPCCARSQRTAESSAFGALQARSRRWGGAAAT